MYLKYCLLPFLGILIFLDPILSYSANSLTYKLVATKKVPQRIEENSITYGQYLITNQSETHKTAVLKTSEGVEQLLGHHLCSKPIQLAPGETCTLNLRIDASKIKKLSITNGLAICDFQNKKSSEQRRCSIPKGSNALKLQIKPCSAEGCLSAEVAGNLRTATEKLKEKFQIPGIVAGLWTNQGNLIIETGYADLENQVPMNRQDHFRIGSITKSFTVNLVLQLMDQGLLDLKTPLSTYFPKMHNNQANMGELAEMRSGIFNYTEDHNFISHFVNDLTQFWEPQQLVDYANSNLPYFTAGKDWHYSNTNTILLGMIIEQLSGRPLGEMLANSIFKPLNLKDTFYPQNIAMPKPFAKGYGFDPLQDVTETEPSSAAGSGAMVSNLKDLRHWARVLALGELLQPATQKMRLDSLKAITYSPCADELSSRPRVNCPEYDKYGMGIGEIDGWVGHTAEFVGYSSLIMFNPKTQSVIVILMNKFGVTPHHPAVVLFKEYLKEMGLAQS